MEFLFSISGVVEWRKGQVRGLTLSIMGTMGIHSYPPRLPRPTPHQGEVRLQHISALELGLHSNWKGRCKKKVKTKQDGVFLIPGGKEELVPNTSFLVWFNSKHHKQLTEERLLLLLWHLYVAGQGGWCKDSTQTNWLYFIILFYFLNLFHLLSYGHIGSSLLRTGFL